jgi:hypothetical protein
MMTFALQAGYLALLSETDLAEEYYDGKDCFSRGGKPFLRKEYHHRYPVISGIRGQHYNTGGQ